MLQIFNTGREYQNALYILLSSSTHLHMISMDVLSNFKRKFYADTQNKKRENVS